ncbi:unnamed protein product, partial [Mesorhabditis belari]|uniref:C-type lectin domain-containing protein n=1 Tax=Mesorhabditis belari TaxID=2138241 RepID=A0AAF3EUL5_9BILA
MLNMVKNILADMNKTLHKDIVQLKGQLALTNANLAALRRSLLAEWTKIGEKRIRIFTSPLDWQTANETCQAFPARLIRINGSTENKQLTDLLSNQHDSLFWIGEQMKVDYSSDKRFHKFPASTTCVTISQRGTWTGRECTEKLPFICAIEN